MPWLPVNKQNRRIEMKSEESAMIFSSLIHDPKSALSYAYDENTLHLRLKTARGEVKEAEVLAVDPFNWIPRGDGTPIYDFDKSSVKHIAMVKEQVTANHDCWFAEIPDINWKRTKYCFVISNDTEKYLIGSRNRIPYSEEDSVLYNLSNYYNYPYINEEDLYKAPEWVTETVWYQIFPERFCNGTPGDERDVLPWGSDAYDGYDKKFGGNLAGIIEKLDYIKESGFNGIYLNPIFESPSSHKYDTTDYYTIDPEFGDNETFGRLVKEAHKRGIKIMLDAVFNHCGFNHPFWQDVLKNGKNSRYYDCFYIIDPEKPYYTGELRNGQPQDCPKEELNYRTFAYTQTMPKWNTGNPIAREYLLDVAAYWINEYHIDGWRLDVSNEISHDFWRAFRKKVKTIDPEVYILGENWDNSYPWLQGDQFDGVMNYEFTTPVWSFFGTEEKGGMKLHGKEFKEAISSLLTAYPKHVTNNLYNLLDSHDTERILHVVQGNQDIAKLAYIFLFTYPGTPCIYYGSEIGMGGGEHSNRQCMVWEEERQNKELYNLIKTLIRLRKEKETFRTENFQWIEGNTSADTIIYKKTTPAETLYVLLHNEGTSEIISLPEELTGLVCVDSISASEVILSESIELLPYDFRLYTVKGE